MLLEVGGFRFPQHYAAASLKRALDCAVTEPHQAFSAALRCGLIEARSVRDVERGGLDRFPQHYAAASLKLVSFTHHAPAVPWFSAALRCGLIEAG